MQLLRDQHDRRSSFIKILFIAVVVAVVLVALGLALSVRVVKQYQKGELSRLGKALGAREPGLRLIIPFADALHRPAQSY